MVRRPLPAPLNRSLARTLAGSLAVLVAVGVPSVPARGTPASAPAVAAPVSTAPSTGLQAGRSAWVRVAMARLWQSPGAPRAVDRPALTAPVHLRRWLAAMSLSQRRALSSHSDTEALLGERVVVRELRGSWARVVVPDQPSPKARGGYPGWIPTRQLTATAPPRTSRVATVVQRTVWLRHDDAAATKTAEISSGTTLPYLGRAGSWVRVQLPTGVRRIAASTVAVHDRGTPAIPGHGVLATALHYRGLAYLWGGLSGFGLDCSGLTWLSYRLHGIRIPRDALPQSRSGTRVARSALHKGDLIFYATHGVVHHVTMYAGSGRMIEAPRTGARVTVDPVRSSGYWGARRY
jgi:cell wall-associated NlpC family hydrolase